MTHNSLTEFIDQIKENWQGLNSTTVVKCQTLLKQLTKTPTSEPWLAKLHREKPAAVELYRDPEHGFILLAHVEQQDCYHPPHNHGNGWVCYAIQSGVMEMSTYSAVNGENEQTNLITRGASQINVGECSTYLPGDIHDTKCLSEYALLFRLTSCDFTIEKREGRLMQFV